MEIAFCCTKIMRNFVGVLIHFSSTNVHRKLCLREVHLFYIVYFILFPFDFNFVLCITKLRSEASHQAIVKMCWQFVYPLIDFKETSTGTFFSGRVSELLQSKYYSSQETIKQGALISFRSRKQLMCCCLWGCWEISAYSLLQVFPISYLI